MEYRGHTLESKMIRSLGLKLRLLIKHFTTFLKKKQFQEFREMSRVCYNNLLNIVRSRMSYKGCVLEKTDATSVMPLAIFRWPAEC